MSEITIIGDVHGKWKEYESKLMGIPGRSIQIGDMGMGFGGRKTLRLPGNAKWFRGNHDNPQMCREHPNYLGDYGFLPQDSLFYIAGAWSIDRAWRTPMVSWWPDEELNWQELDAALDLYIKSKPRFVISHEAPTCASTWLLTMVAPGFRPEKIATTRTGQAMERMLDYHKPEKWIFGHYHIDKTFDFHGVEFKCLNELSTYVLETGNGH